MVLAEDKRTERFFRRLLGHLGFDCRRVRFITAPSGQGAAEAWVRRQYPGEVRALRSRSFQRDLFLVAVRDGDNVGVEIRKRELDQELVEDQQLTRKPSERIATPVPTWSIETWVLALLGVHPLDEGRSYKLDFDNAHARQERQAVARAVKSWLTIDAEGQPPSMLDARGELARLDRD